MIADILAGLFAADTGEAPRGVAQALRFWPLLAGPHLLALCGLALLMSLLFPARHGLAAARLRQAPLVGFAIGALVLIPIVALFSALKHQGIVPGQHFLILAFAVCTALGFATCGRALGERALPGRPAVAHTALGLIALILPLLSPVCLPILAVVPPLGLGAWLLAGRAKDATMP